VLDALEILAHREIGAHDVDRDAGLAAQAIGELVELGLVAGDEHEVVAALGEPVGVTGTDAGGSARDEHAGFRHVAILSADVLMTAVMIH
jgi:hypothetical protein